MYIYILFSIFVHSSWLLIYMHIPSTSVLDHVCIYRYVHTQVYSLTSPCLLLATHIYFTMFSNWFITINIQLHILSMEKIRHHLGWLKPHINNRINHLATGGFLPSTDLKTTTRVHIPWSNLKVRQGRPLVPLGRPLVQSGQDATRPEKIGLAIVLAWKKMGI